MRVLRDGSINFGRGGIGAPTGYNFDELLIRGGTARFGGFNIHVVVAALTMEGGTLTNGGILTVTGSITATSIAPAGGFPGSRAVLTTETNSFGGELRLGTSQVPFEIADGPEAIDAEFNITIAATGAAGVNKLGAGVAAFSGDNSYTGETTVTAGTLLINGNSPSSNVVVGGGRLGGTGTVGAVNASTGSVAPGASPECCAVQRSASRQA